MQQITYYKLQLILFDMMTPLIWKINDMTLNLIRHLSSLAMLAHVIEALCFVTCNDFLIIQNLQSITLWCKADVFSILFAHFWGFVVPILEKLSSFANFWMISLSMFVMSTTRNLFSTSWHQELMSALTEYATPYWETELGAISTLTQQI